jgi:hypothetical protein
LAALKEEVKRPHGRNERREGREGEQPMHLCASEEGEDILGGQVGDDTRKFQCWLVRQMLRG